MAFEGVNADSLHSALTSCKDTINYQMTEDIISTVNHDTWNTRCSEKLIEGLRCLRDEKYHALLNLLEQYEEVPELIAEYQRLQGEVNSLNVEIEEYSAKMSSLKQRINDYNVQIQNTQVETYSVQSGDSLYAIAESMGVNVYDLCNANGISLNDIIYSGQSLVKPGTGDTSGLEAAKSDAQAEYWDANHQLGDRKEKKEQKENRMTEIVTEVNRII